MSKAKKNIFHRCNMFVTSFCLILFLAHQSYLLCLVVRLMTSVYWLILTGSVIIQYDTACDCTLQSATVLQLHQSPCIVSSDWPRSAVGPASLRASGVEVGMNDSKTITITRSFPASSIKDFLFMKYTFSSGSLILALLSDSFTEWSEVLVVVLN